MNSFSIQLGLLVSLFAVPCAFAEDAPKLINKQFYREKIPKGWEKQNYITNMAFSPDGKSLCALKGDGELLLLGSKEEDKPTIIASKINGFSIGQESKWVRYFEESKLKYYTLSGLKNDWDHEGMRLPRGFSNRILPLCDDNELYSSEISLERLDLKTGKTVLIGKYESDIWSSTVNAKAKRFAAIMLKAGTDTPFWVEIWDFSKELKSVKLTPERHPHSIVFSPDGSGFAVGFEDGTIQLFDSESMKSKLQLQISPEPKQYRISDFAFDKSGRYLVCSSYDGGGDHNLYVVDTESKKVIRSFAAGETSILKMCLSEAGDRLAVAEWKHVTIWDTKDLFKVEAEKK